MARNHRSPALIRRMAGRPLLSALLTSGMLAAVATGATGAHAGPAEKAYTRTANDPAVAWGPCPAFLPEGCRLAVLHGDPAKENADVLFRVPGGSVLAHHKHTSPERIVLLSGEMSVRYDGQSKALLWPGTYAYGPAGVAHSATCLSKEPCVLFIGFIQPVDAIPVTP